MVNALSYIETEKFGFFSFRGFLIQRKESSVLFSSGENLSDGRAVGSNSSNSVKETLDVFGDVDFLVFVVIEISSNLNKGKESHLTSLR
jgi:hypothetical protein